MNQVAAFLAVNIALVVANAVAAGVVLSLAPIATHLVHDAHEQWWPWAMITLCATAAALLFLRLVAR